MKENSKTDHTSRCNFPHKDKALISSAWGGNEWECDCRCVYVGWVFTIEDPVMCMFSHHCASGNLCLWLIRQPVSSPWTSRMCCFPIDLVEMLLPVEISSCLSGFLSPSGICMLDTTSIDFVFSLLRLPQRSCSWHRSEDGEGMDSTKSRQGKRH